MYDVEIRGTDVAIRESFRNTRGGVWLFARALVTTTSTLLVLLAVFRRLRGGRHAMFSVLTLGGICLAALTAWLAFDYFWWSGTYYDRLALQVRGTPSAVGIAVEKARERVLGLEPLSEIELHPWSRDFRRGVQPLLAFLGAASDLEPDRDDAIEVVRERDGRVEVDIVDANPAPIEEYLSKKPVARALRIMLLGGSQMWGEGANLRRERIDAAVLTRVTKDVAPTPVVVINGSRRGGVAPFLADRLEEGGLHLFEPAVVVVNLSGNDSADLEGFAAGLTRIAESCRKRGAKLVFVQEAGRGGPPGSAHEVMKTVAARFGIPLANLQSWLDADGNRDSGFLWWDGVHLTSWGQALAADFIHLSVRAAVTPTLYHLHR